MRHGISIIIRRKLIIDNIIINRHVGPPLENGASIHKRLALVASQFVDSCDNISCNQYPVPDATVAATTSAKIHEVVRTVRVESGAESDAGDGTGLHGVVR